VLAVQQQQAGGGGGEWVEVEGQDKGICTVANLGLRDCGVLAWRVVGDVGGFLVEVAGGEEEEEDEEEGEDGEDGEEEGNGSGNRNRNGYWGTEGEDDGELEVR